MFEPTSLPAAQRLPRELFKNIFDVENFRIKCFEVEKHRAVLQAGLSISLVCRDWLDYGRSILLWQQKWHIEHFDRRNFIPNHVEPPGQKPRNAWDTILRYPYLGAYVEELRFTVLEWRLAGRAVRFREIDGPGRGQTDDAVEAKLQLFTSTVGLLTSLKALYLISVPAGHFLPILSTVTSVRLHFLSWSRVAYSDEPAVTNGYLNRLRSELCKQRNLKELNYFDHFDSPPLVNEHAPSRLFVLPSNNQQQLHLEDITLESDGLTTTFFLQSTSKSNLRKVVLLPVPFGTACLIGSEFKNVKTLELHSDCVPLDFLSIVHTLEAQALLRCFPGLTHLCLSTVLKDLSHRQPVLRIELEELLRALPMTLKSLELKIPSCAYKQNLEIIDAFWLQQDRPDLTYWKACADKEDIKLTQMDLIAHLKGKHPET